MISQLRWVIWHMWLVWILPTKCKTLKRVETCQKKHFNSYGYLFYSLSRFILQKVLLSGYSSFQIYFRVEPWLFHLYGLMQLSRGLWDTWILLCGIYHHSVQVLSDQLCNNHQSCFRFHGQWLGDEGFLFWRSRVTRGCTYWESTNVKDPWFTMVKVGQYPPIWISLAAQTMIVTAVLITSRNHLIPFQ